MILSRRIPIYPRLFVLPFDRDSFYFSRRDIRRQGSYHRKRANREMAGYPRGVGRIIMDIRSGRVSLDFFFSFPFNRNRTTDSGAVRVARGARAPLIRHWPRLVLSVSSWLILNCDVLTGSREIYRPRAFSCARLDHEADTLNLKETTATRTRVSAPDVSLSPLFVSLLAVVSFVSLLPSLSLYPTRCSKKGRKRRR